MNIKNDFKSSNHINIHSRSRKRLNPNNSFFNIGICIQHLTFVLNIQRYGWLDKWIKKLS